MLTGPTGEVLRRAHPMGGGTPIALRGLVWWTFWHVTLFCAWIRVNTPLWRAHLGGPFRCWGKEFHEAHSLNETSYTHGCLIVWGGMDLLTSFSSMGISREIMTDFFSSSFDSNEFSLVWKCLFWMVGTYGFGLGSFLFIWSIIPANSKVEGSRRKLGRKSGTFWNRYLYCTLLGLI